MMDLNKAINFIWENARLLERAVFEYRFYDAPSSRILDVLKAYQEADGGFGQALEPDLRAPDSQPLFVEFALRMLYECNLRDLLLSTQACNFVAAHADLDRGIPTIFASSRRYPRAAHWTNPASEQPSMERLTGLVGLLKWQDVRDPWLERAVDACVEHILGSRYDDAHTIRTAFALVESLSGTREVEKLFQKLSDELRVANFFSLEVPVVSYALTPLDFAPQPESYCQKLFTQAQIDAHLDDLASKQDHDGGWSIQWEPPGEMARLEWRAYKTVSAIGTLHLYGRI
jgi:hypothetical protein